MDELAEDTGKTPGVDRMLKYFEEKLKLVTVSDIGHNIEKFFKTVSREHGEAMTDYVLRYEKYVREMTESLKAFDPDVKEVMCKPLRARWLLRHSSLPPKGRANIL